MANFMPFLIMTCVQLGYAGMNIISKLAMDSGMSPFVHVAYRQLFASAVIVPIAFFIERKTRPQLNLRILFHIFLCSIFGKTMNQITYFVGLKNSTATIACALSNLSPAVTFLVAILLRLETGRVRSKAGISKMLGTTVCIGGALLLSLYDGPVVNVGKSDHHWKPIEHSKETNSSSHSDDFFLGIFLLITSSVSRAILLIIQAKLAKIYKAPYSSSALTCSMASIECVAVGFWFEQNIAAWSLNPPIRALSCLYAGIVCGALAFCAMSWCTERKGPLYVSVFSPLSLIFVAGLSCGLLKEKLHAERSALIVLGLYGVVLGMNMEEKDKIEIQEQCSKEDDLCSSTLQDLFNDTL